MKTDYTKRGRTKPSAQDLNKCSFQRLFMDEQGTNGSTCGCVNKKEAQPADHCHCKNKEAYPRRHARRCGIIRKAACSAYSRQKPKTRRKWKNPATILHTALTTAASAIPRGSFVFDPYFLERVVQEIYPDYHAQAQNASACCTTWENAAKTSRKKCSCP